MSQFGNQDYVNLFYGDDMYRNFAVLKLSVQSTDPVLLDMYREHVAKHNESIRNTEFPNAGFDLFVPTEVELDEAFYSQMVDLQVKAEMIYSDITLKHVSPSGSESDDEVGGISYSTGYYMFPRSSMSKTPLMLANHTGIIDSGYRGSLKAAVRWLPETPKTYRLAAYTRLFQICHPSLCPVYVVLVDDAELTSTERGQGGFGSTGILGV